MSEAVNSFILCDRLSAPMKSETLTYNKHIEKSL
jgi:hypothetical protein